EHVHGDIACALAFDLGALQGMMRTYAPRVDAMLEHGGKVAPVAERLAGGVGLMYPSIGAQTATDNELREECRRRGWHPEMGLAPRYVARIQNVDPAPSPGFSLGDSRTATEAARRESEDVMLITRAMMLADVNGPLAIEYA